MWHHLCPRPGIMEAFLAAIVSFPTVVFTVPLLIIVGYWLLVIVGAVGSDLLDGATGKLEGAASAKIEGLADAALAKVDGAADVALAKVDGVADAALGKVDGAADTASGKLEVAAGAAVGASALSAIGFGKMPATVVISSLVLWAWAVSVSGVLWLGKLGLAGPVTGLGVAVAAVFVGGAVTGMIARLAERAMPKHRPIRRSQLVGKIASVTTGRVDERFGQATLYADGGELVVDVRCDTPNRLARHVKVVLVSYDDERHVYAVEAFEESVQAVPGGEDSPPRA